MTHYTYLIIGGGMTADAAVRGIREIDEEGSIGLISEEANPPYNRPPLSKGLWTGQSLDTIWRNTDELGVDLHLERRVERLDADKKEVTDNQGDNYTFDKLLLATGGTPRQLPFGDEHIIYFRTLADFENLQDLAEERNHFAVIGGGFIGSEIAAALAMNEKEVVMLFPEEGIGALAFPPDLAEFLNDYYQNKGVELKPGRMVNGLERRENQFVLRTESDEEIVADGVVAGIGIAPNIDLAEQAGLEIDEKSGGIVVDQALQTGHPDIYAAGDVAAFYNPALDKRIRIEHEDNANRMGQQAGRAMAGEAVTYDYLPYFYSDLFDLSYEALGELNPELDIVADWGETYKKGVIYYLHEGRVRGVILWNVWGMKGAARDLIAGDETFEPDDVKGQIPIV